MGLVFIDGCSHYSNVLHKYGAASSATIGTTDPPRTGAKYLDLPTTLAYAETRDFGAGAARLSVGCRIYLPNASYDMQGISFCNGSTAQITLQWEHTTGSLVVRRGGSSGTILATSAAGLMVAGRWYYLEFGARINDTLGSTEVRLNGSPVAELTLTDVDTMPGAENTIDRFRLMGCARFTDIWIDQGLSLEYYGDCIVDTIMPTGAGTNADWTPSAGANYQNVDDAGTIDDDETFNSSNTAGDVDTFACGDLPSRPGSTILAVAVNVAARKDDAATRELMAWARIGSSEYAIGSAFQPTGDYIVHQKIEAENPADSAAWEDADVNGAEFGYKQYSIS